MAIADENPPRTLSAGVGGWGGEALADTPPKTVAPSRGTVVHLWGRLELAAPAGTAAAAAEGARVEGFTALGGSESGGAKMFGASPPPAGPVAASVAAAGPTRRAGWRAPRHGRARGGRERPPPRSGATARQRWRPDWSTRPSPPAAAGRPPAARPTAGGGSGAAAVAGAARGDDHPMVALALTAGTGPWTCASVAPCCAYNSLRSRASGVVTCRIHLLFSPAPNHRNFGRGVKRDHVQITHEITQNS